jgi:hypothetical protein
LWSWERTDAEIECSFWPLLAGVEPLTHGGDGIGSLKFTRSIVSYAILDAYYLTKRGMRTAPRSDTTPRCPVHTCPPFWHSSTSAGARHSLPAHRDFPLGQHPAKSSGLPDCSLVSFRGPVEVSSARRIVSTRALGLGRRLAHVARRFARRLSDRSVLV